MNGYLFKPLWPPIAVIFLSGDFQHRFAGFLEISARAIGSWVGGIAQLCK